VHLAELVDSFKLVAAASRAAQRPLLR
jgi:hypothetical protein